MTQDQWDLYKLDPEYDCVVRAHPNLTTITRVTSNKDTIDLDDTFISGSPDTRKGTSAPPDDYSPTSKAKQGPSPACSDNDMSRDKRHKSMGVKQTFSSQTDSMSVDEDPSYIPNREDHVKHQDVVNRKKRRRVLDHLGGCGVSEPEKLKRTPPAHRGLRFDYLIVTALRLTPTLE